jgi:Rhodopirellula transposase DDE domain
MCCVLNRAAFKLSYSVFVNWRGQPLVSYEAVVNLIGGTRTRSGLKVKAMLDTRTYEKGQKISAQQIQELNLRGQAFHPDWNYTISPRKTAR